MTDDMQHASHDTPRHARAPGAARGIAPLALAALAAAALLAGAGGCRKDNPLVGSEATALALSKAQADEDWGSPEAPLPFSQDGRTVMLAVEPAAGPFAGWVRLEAVPGTLTRIFCDPPDCRTECPVEEAIGRNLKVANARRDVCVEFALSFGETHVVATDIGFAPAPPETARCNDGLDNDGDGTTDFGDDSGCAFVNDDSEEAGTAIVGISPTLFFANPRVENVQGYASYSPLERESVNISGGRMVVTRISTEGFYVTDLDPQRPGAGYNHLYAYNYNTPWGLRECDILSSLSGIVVEFFGFTELSYPTWEFSWDNARVEAPQSAADCLIPEPAALTAREIDNAATMESNESGLVQITTGSVGAVFTGCDLNQDGRIDWEGEEGACKTTCDKDAGCTEVSQLYSYGQWALKVEGRDGEGKQLFRKVFVVSRDSYPELDPMANAGRKVKVARGVLKQIEFVDPPWLLEIRCKDDFVFEDEGRDAPPVWQACVPPHERGWTEDNN